MRLIGNDTTRYGILQDMVHACDKIISRYRKLYISTACSFMMEFENHTVGRLLNSSDERSTQVYLAIGIIHLVIVVIPSLVIAPMVLYYIYYIVKESGIKPVILLYAVVAVLCFAGPLTHGILNDVGVIANIPVYGYCSSPYLTGGIQIQLTFGMHTTILITLTLISAVQFSMLYFRFQITIKMVCTVLLFLVVYSFAIYCIEFIGTYREIRGPLCAQEGEKGIITTTFLVVTALVIPLIITVHACSVLTWLITKNSTVNNAGNSAARSVVVLIIFNIVCFVAVRIPGLVIVLLGKPQLRVAEQQETLSALVVIGQYTIDVNYPLTAFSILVLHSGIRRMAFSCCNFFKKTVTTTGFPVAQSSEF